MGIALQYLHLDK